MNVKCDNPNFRALLRKLDGGKYMRWQRWLAAWEEGVSNDLFLKAEPLFDEMRSDPRFQAVLKRRAWNEEWSCQRACKCAKKVASESLIPQGRNFYCTPDLQLHF